MTFKIKGIVEDAKITQMWLNKLESELTNNNFDKMFPSKPYVPPTRWQRIKRFFVHLTEYRIVHQDRIDNEEW